MDRTWCSYNESLVKRGEFFISLEFLETWFEELAAMNTKKRGRPYEYPNGLMQFCSVIYTFFGLPYRQTEGVLRGLGKRFGFPAPDYTTPFRRMQKIEFDIPQTDEPIVVALDSTGIKVTTRGEWMHKVWNGEERKGWIKVHISADVRTKKLCAIEVTNEKCHDCQVFPKLLEPVPRIADVLADGAYDTRECFNYLDKRGVGPPGIRVRDNASTKPHRCWLRQQAVLERRKLGYKGWKEKHDYGMRWPGSEGIFSAVKRCFGESVRATSQDGMVREVKRRFCLYSLLL